MTEYIHLIGAEQVQSAAVSIRGAAEEINRAAMNLDSTYRQHQQFLEDWLQRFAQVLEQQAATKEGGE